MLTNKEKLTAQAQKFIEKGQYERAIREYLKIVAEDEKDVRTWLKIGDLFVKLGQKAQAAQTYQKVARFYADQGFYLKSVAVYKQILKIDPRLIDVNLALAELYQQLGLVQDAIGQYEAVAAFLQREGRGRDAISAHRAALDLDPENVAQRIKLAELYSKEDMAKEAAREFRRTAEQLRALGRTEDFLKVGERLLFHDPEDSATARELATLYLERGDARRALTKLQISFKADPRDPQTLDLLSRAFLALGQHQKSISVLKELGRVLMETDRREQAIAIYHQILALDPADGDARAVLSASQPAMLALAALAATDAPPSLSLPPLSASPPPGPLSPAGRSQPPPSMGSGGSGGAVSGSGASSPPASGRSAPLPSDEEVARTLTEADVYAKYGLYQKSIEHLKRALERQPQNRPVRERLVGLFEATGQPAAAIAELWALFGQAATLEEAAGCLSEILRIDPQNKAALHRWQEMSGGSRASAARATVPGLGPEISPDEPVGPMDAARARRGEGQPESLQDELDEVDFFLRQSMHAEARQLLDGLLQRYPGSAVIRHKLEELGAAPEAAMAVEEVVAEAPEPAESIPGTVYEMTRQGLREKGASRTSGSRSAAASYFELGVAYRDMGLYADAIAELRKAMQDRRREVQCRTLIGLCMLEQDLLAEAAAELKLALYVPGVSDKQLTEVYYHLGRAYEQMANQKESIYFYELAIKLDASFRDTRERVAYLRTQEAGGGAEGPEG